MTPASIVKIVRYMNKVKDARYGDGNKTKEEKDDCNDDRREVDKLQVTDFH